MDDLSISTSEPGGDTSAADSQALATTSGGANEVGQVASDALSQASTGAVTDPLEAALASIPDSDDDLQTEADVARKAAVIAQRGQLRVLRNAVRDLQPLSIFREFGTPAAVKPRLELAKLLYSPLLRDGQPVRDPATQTTYVTTKPFITHLDKVSPGMPEQLYVDLNYFEPLAEDGVTKQEALWKQHFRYLKLDPARLPEYQKIDALIARTSDAITPEELAEIPADYHAAYRTIPPSIRSAWASFDEADQTRMLEDYKGRLDDAADKAERKAEAEREKLADAQAHAARVYQGQLQYFNKVRQERFAELYTDLAEQVTFSTDATANGIEIGSLCTTLANLLDPNWRFITVERILTPLGLKLPAGFDEVLNRFDQAASDKVALEMAGDIGRAGDAETEALHAVEQLIAKIAPIALKIAAKRGANVKQKAAATAATLASAAAGRTTVTGQPPAPLQSGKLPEGIRPGTQEAAMFLARQSGFVRDAPAA